MGTHHVLLQVCLVHVKPPFEVVFVTMFLYGIEKQQAGVHDLVQRYRRCKRQIRDDAAASLQALIRGFHVRNRKRSAQRNSINAQELKKKLKEEKRELKQKLKDYDRTFAQQHGRLPTKSEKEPIRWLYEQYNNVKART